MNAAEAAQRLLPHTEPVREHGQGSAPANIALCKYWGKRNEELKLPLTGSLSVSLGPLGTETIVTRSDRDRFILSDDVQSPKTPACRRLFDFLDLFREPDCAFEITSTNTIPTAAGLASSASGFAALVKALNDLYQWNLGTKELSILARLGSGSASRSLEHGFVEWSAGIHEDGSDSYARRLEVEWPDFRVGILTLSTDSKPVGSTEGMRRTMDTSALYASWPAEVNRALPLIRQAVLDRDFPALGAAAEQNALSMHATMIASWPPILYWKPETLEILHRVQSLRAEGVEVYATLDAGPNVKLLFTATDQETLSDTFPALQVVSPFGPTPS